ncbi:hypothetical protein ACWKWU_14930 [Chitinophaga lutea]
MNKLKNVLLINALSSGAVGLLLILFPGYIAGLFGATLVWPFTATGIFLVAFAAIVFMQGRKTIPVKGWVKLIIALDIIWVVDSLFVILAQLFGLSMIAYVLIAGVAAWVGMMAFLQTKGLRYFAEAR